MDPNSSSSSEIQHVLYDAVMKKERDKVLRIYKEHPEIHAAKITKSEDTALHVAIAQGAPEEFVEKLVDEIEKNNRNITLQTLAAKNQRGDTPLHYAALSGSPNMCRIILRHELELLDTSLLADVESLVCKRNKHGETPLFVAALNGYKETFRYLYSVCFKMRISSCPRLWRRKNGDTILHCTIQREYFDLSLLIMHLYENQKIGSSANEEGTAPLEVLASIPSAFESGTRLSWWERLCYNYTRVELLKFDAPPDSYVIDIEDQTQFLKADDPAECHQTRGSIRRIKEKHVWGLEIMVQLVKQNSQYEYNQNESAPHEDLSNETQLLQIMTKKKDDEKNEPLDPEYLMKIMSGDEQNQQDNPVLKWLQEAQALLFSSYGYLAARKPSKKDKTALIIATKYGLIELVNQILYDLPVSIYDKTPKKKRNLVLQAVQKRQPYVLESLMKHKLWPRLREAVDAEGNNALHLAAKLSKRMPWEISGAAMQMQWEVKWFEYVKEHLPPYLISQTNVYEETPGDIFEEEHKCLMKQSNEWLRDTAGSYSIVAALTAGATFGASIQVPGGNDDKSGKPIMQGQPNFRIFSVAVLVAFCTSATSLAMFLSIFSSRKQPRDFKKKLPLKLLWALTSFFVSIFSILAAFCAAHSFELDPGNSYKPTPLYSLTLVPLCTYAAAQVPLYLLLLRASFTKLPQPKYVGEPI